MSTPRPTYYIPVHGTWDLGQDAWWRHGSLFCKEASKENLYCKEEIEPFYWASNIDGVFGRHTVWDASGYSLKLYLKQFHLHERNLILHSYGLSVAAYCDIPMNNIISVGSPIRKDMHPFYERLRRNCHRWMHVKDISWDKMAILGQFFDGQWFGSRNCPFAHENLSLKKIGHSSILRDPKNLQLWKTEGLYDFLRQ